MILATVVPVLTMLTVCRLPCLGRDVGELDRGRCGAQAVLGADAVDAKEIGLAVGRFDRQRAVSLARVPSARTSPGPSGCRPWPASGAA